MSIKLPHFLKTQAGYLIVLVVVLVGLQFFVTLWKNQQFLKTSGLKPVQNLAQQLQHQNLNLIEKAVKGWANQLKQMGQGVTNPSLDPFLGVAFVRRTHMQGSWQMQWHSWRVPQPEGTINFLLSRWTAPEQAMADDTVHLSWISGPVTQGDSQSVSYSSFLFVQVFAAPTQIRIGLLPPEVWVSLLGISPSEASPSSPSPLLQLVSEEGESIWPLVQPATVGARKLAQANARQEHLAMQIPVPKTNLVLKTSLWTPSYAQALEEQIGASTILSIGLLLFLAALLWQSTARFRHHLIHLRCEVDKIRAGEWNISAKEGSDEVGQLAKGLRQMCKRLQEWGDNTINKKSKQLEEQTHQIEEEKIQLATVLRHPFSLVLGHIHLACDQNLSDEAKRHLVLVENEARRAQKIIDDFEGGSLPALNRQALSITPQSTEEAQDSFLAPHLSELQTDKNHSEGHASEASTQPHKTTSKESDEMPLHAEFLPPPLPKQNTPSSAPTHPDSQEMAHESVPLAFEVTSLDSLSSLETTEAKKSSHTTFLRRDLGSRRRVLAKPLKEELQLSHLEFEESSVKTEKLGASSSKESLGAYRERALNAMPLFKTQLEELMTTLVCAADTKNVVSLFLEFLQERTKHAVLFMRPVPAHQSLVTTQASSKIKPDSLRHWSLNFREESAKSYQQHLAHLQESAYLKHLLQKRMHSPIESTVRTLYLGKRLHALFVVLGALSEEEGHEISAFMKVFPLFYERTYLQEKLREISIRDHLTNLYNRRHLNERLESEMSRSRRTHHALSLLYLDIDDFKHYNDQNGHAMGDVLLKNLASIFLQISRKNDVIIRMGGEEFLILLPHTDVKGAVAKAENLRRCISKVNFPHRERQPLGKITVSIGVSSYPTLSRDAQELITSADFAMYQAKRAGKNRIGLSRVPSSFQPDFDPVSMVNYPPITNWEGMVMAKQEKRSTLYSGLV